ncbi:MAG: DUF4446 family protein, partial [Chloroflexota bacterium]|nr:DUF4446 family protein [Chloroflexota bacterium]
VVVIAMLAWLVVIQVRLRRLGRQQTGLVAPEAGQALDDCLAQVTDLKHTVEILGENLNRSLQACGIVRFNPFSDTGGDQSFVIALADAHGNGVVISSLYSRTRSRVYAKPLRNWGSSYTLTDEEREAIARARGCG